MCRSRLFTVGNVPASIGRMAHQPTPSPPQPDPKPVPAPMPSPEPEPLPPPTNPIPAPPMRTQASPADGRPGAAAHQVDERTRDAVAAGL
jgi:hypothetical protein